LYPWKDVFAPLYYTISPIKTEREGIIYNKKIKGFVEKDVLYPWKNVFAPLYYTISPIKTERERIISI
jgi:hypothetical protein